MAIRILHVFSTFVPGGPQVRTVTVLNRLGSEFAHEILAMDGRVDAASRLRPDLNVRLIPSPPHKNSLIAAWHLRRTILHMEPALVATYNWGAIDAVLGARLAGICPVIHTEDGFGLDEATRLKARRVLTRHVVLNGIYRTIVPSEHLWRVALGRYRIRKQTVQLIPNGVDTDRFRPRPLSKLRRGWGINDTDIVCGYVGHFRPEKNVGLLMRAFAAAWRPGMRLALVGDGPCRRELEQLARSLQLEGSIVFAGPIEDTAPCYNAFDLFLMSSLTEQMPMGLIEAMASGLPVLCTNVGDTRVMLAEVAHHQVVPADEVYAYSSRLRILCESPALRVELGATNRQRCVSSYTEMEMVATYRRLYQDAVQSRGCPA